MPAKSKKSSNGKGDRNRVNDKKKFDKKGLKKDFKKRYGKEGDAVMYATINKMAKKNA